MDTTKSKARSFHWKKIHHDWRFWLGFLLIIVALIIYIMSEDLSIQPAGLR